MALAKGFAGCFVCIVTMLLKIELYNRIYVRESALAERVVKRLKNIKISLYTSVTL
jgi:hypothetical protein